MALLFSSCGDIVEESLLTSVKSENILQTKSGEVDSLLLGSIIPLEETEELKALREEFIRNKSQAVSPYALYDPYFSSNMYAIRELAVNLEARSAPSGSGKFLYSNGAGKEITLSTNSSNVNARFYFQVLPASSGIPYMIYSQQTKTPLSVGQYDNAPNDKVLFAPKDNSGSSFSASWDLVQSNVTGYFAIQSQSYLGQGNSGSMWDIFYHVLEAKADNKVRYGKYSNSSYQEFRITPINQFTLSDELIFDVSRATVTELTPVPKIFETNNLKEQQSQIIVDVKLPFDETSNFQENKLINFSLNGKKYARPTVEAGRLTQPKEGANKDATYRANETIRHTVSFPDNIDAPGRCKVEITYKLATYRVSVPYTVKASYGSGRVVTLSGTWTGTLYLHPDYKKPDKTARYWDLETGKEIFLQ